MTKRKGTRGREKECADAPAAGVGHRSDPVGASMAGDAGVPVFPRPGFGPNNARVGNGAAAAAGSVAKSGRSSATVGRGLPGAAGSSPVAAANGSSFTGTAPPNLGNYGCSSAASSMGGFPLDFSSSWDGSAGASLIPPPFVHHQARDRDPRPPGGFMSFFHNQPQQSYSPNFHQAGASHWFPFKAPQQVNVVGDSSPVTPAPHPSRENQVEQDTINVDSGDEIVRTEKRILWTPDEDYRLMSAWLNNSMDPINGNDKRNEQYWDDVAQTYNLTTPGHRKRNMKQAKDRWHKINKWTDLFHSAYVKAQLVYSSGHSEQDWIDKAHKFYLSDNTDLKLGPFVLMDVWYAVRNEPKWITYNNGLKKARKRKESNKEDESEDITDANNPLPRPIGQKKAKKLLYEGKSAKSAIDVVDLDKFDRIQSEAHANRLKVLEIQQKLSAEKMESSKIARLAAKEQKEARKLELDARMMETYTLLMNQNQGQMSDQEKADHVLTLKCLRKRLFPETT